MAMAVEHRRNTSIYLTFKIIQLVNRLKSRVSGLSTRSSSLGSRTCLGLESKALRSVQKSLARVNPHGEKQLQHSSNRVRKYRKTVRPSLKLHTTGGHDAVNQNTSGDEVQHAIQALDRDGNISPRYALSAVCSDDKLFLQNDRTAFETCSLNETIGSLVLVHEAINVLYAARSQHDDAFIIAQGHDIGLNIDESFIANYEHLLLRLQSQLIETLTRKVVEALLFNDLDKTQRKLLNWFTEFEGNRHPLNTTWPWSIKPSLAVLWGVCWMFYNSPEQQNTGQPNTGQQNTGQQNTGSRIPQGRLLQNIDFTGWDVPQPHEYFHFGLELVGASSQHQAPQQTGGDDSSIVGEGRHWGLPDLSTQASPSTNASRAAQPLYTPNLQGLGPTPTRPTYYTQAIPPASPGNISNFSIPGQSGIATPTTVFAFSQQLDNLDNSWQLPYTQHTLPQRTGHLTNPTITVTDGSASPHPHFSSVYDQARALQLNTTFSDFAPSPYNMGNCPPQDTSPIHTQSVVRHERTSSVNSNSNIPTPVSLAGGNRSPLLSPADDRRHSIASSHGLVRQPSEESSSQDGDDSGLSPRRNHAYKRAEEPPRNSDGKMICKYKECVSVTFDRKCEWSKHMDKHDRPYKCNVKGCEKLQGFTYSGGLLRHEREVHKLHGGTKKSLFCPFPDCKRSSGSGFTRKENLAEHIRRVHRRTSTSSDLGHMVISRPDTQDDTEDARLQSESPYQRSVDYQDDVQLAQKRKRMSEAGISEAGDETDLRAELKRLRRENEEKDSRLRQLEAAVMALQQGRR